MKKSSHTTIYLLILKIHNRLLENTSEGKILKKKKYIFGLCDSMKKKKFVIACCV